MQRRTATKSLIPYSGNTIGHNNSMQRSAIAKQTGAYSCKRRRQNNSLQRHTVAESTIEYILQRTGQFYIFQRVTLFECPHPKNFHGIGQHHCMQANAVFESLVAYNLCTIANSIFFQTTIGLQQAFPIGAIDTPILVSYSFLYIIWLNIGIVLMNHHSVLIVKLLDTIKLSLTSIIAKPNRFVPLHKFGLRISLSLCFKPTPQTVS